MVLLGDEVVVEEVSAVVDKVVVLFCRQVPSLEVVDVLEGCT